MPRLRNYFCCMELILKQPKGKNPCICILFENTYEASKLNQSWPNNYKTYLYDVTLDIQEGKLDLILKLEGFSLNYKYENIKHYPDKLFRFLYETKGAKQYNFCHIIEHLSKHIVARTTVNQANWVLMVGKLTVKKEE